MDTKLRSQLAANVARGAAWLDQEYPRWDATIELHRLNLHSPCSCILGQRFGDYFAATGTGGPLAAIDVATLGFDLDGDVTRNVFNCGPYWECLTELWHELILARRAAKVELAGDPSPASHAERQRAAAV